MIVSSEVKIVNSFSIVEYIMYEGNGSLFFIIAEYKIGIEHNGTYANLSILTFLKYSPIMYSKLIYGLDASIEEIAHFNSI